MLAIKYGRPTGSPEYINRLPDTVVEQVFKKLNHRFQRSLDLEGKRGLIGLLIETNQVTELIDEALYEYHILLG